MLRMGNLSEESWRTDLSHGVTETENETTGKVSLPVVSDSGDDTTDNHDNTADSDWDSTTEPICDVWNNEERSNGTKIVSVVHETQSGTSWVVEERLPVNHVLGVIHHHSVVSSGGRGNAKNNTPEVQSLHVGLSSPVDMLEFWGLSLSLLEVTMGPMARGDGDSDHRVEVSSCDRVKDKKCR